MKSYVVLIIGILALIWFSLSWFEISQKQTTLQAAPPSWQEAFTYAQANLPKEGRLMRKADGFVYLKVDDDYIHALFPMLGIQEKGFKEPPYFRTKNSPGAHISVFYGDERVIPEEIGQHFSFELKKIVMVKPSKYISYVVLEVESPELEKLREKYGLSPKLHGHEFHITLAKKTSRRKY